MFDVLEYFVVSPPGDPGGRPGPSRCTNQLDFFTRRKMALLVYNFNIYGANCLEKIVRVLQSNLQHLNVSKIVATSTPAHRLGIKEKQTQRPTIERAMTTSDLT